MEIHGMHIDKQQLMESIDSIKVLVEDAQESIRQCSTHFQKSVDEVGFTNDTLTQTIDECEILINDTLDEVNELYYQVQSTDEI